MFRNPKILAPSKGQSQNLFGRCTIQSYIYNEYFDKQQ